MHELLANIYLVFHREALSETQTLADAPGLSAEQVYVAHCTHLTSRAHRETIKHVMNVRYVSHDSYALFNKIMSVTHRWFESDMSRVRCACIHTALTAV
jgi:3-hydroxyisobutyrate dehydrogenase-like beta-hydroxyacid dehydrogenase